MLVSRQRANARLEMNGATVFLTAIGFIFLLFLIA
jgi:hypothetical protein